MAKSDETRHDHLFSSLIADIRSYSGKDPILPWLRGIKKLKETLPTRVLNEKLPRFLQKCAQAFQSDKRYRNDLRYIRVWLQLMDFVDDPKVLLRAMEENQIGIKRSLFYQAYALYYEKMKRYDKAEKIYQLGVQNLAEPDDELQKSYEQFLKRLERHRNNAQRQEGRPSKRPLSDRNLASQCSKINGHQGDIHNPSNRAAEDETWTHADKLKTKRMFGESPLKVKAFQESDSAGFAVSACDSITGKQAVTENGIREPRAVGDDSVVVKFVDTAVVGKSEVEDACHHGLVDPAIDMKEVMDPINSMFQKPIETAPLRRRSQRDRSRENIGSETSFQVFVDENLESGAAPTRRNEQDQSDRVQTCLGSPEPFQIYIDEENDDFTEAKTKEKGYSKVRNSDSRWDSAHSQNSFIFAHPKDFLSEDSDDPNEDIAPYRKFREDTLVHRFVGSTVSHELEAENVCHHGLVDPTINLKEAMNDINSMFGRPIDFVRSRRSKRQEMVSDKKDNVGFSILPDDDDNSVGDLKPKPPCKSNKKIPDTDNDADGFLIRPDDDDGGAGYLKREKIKSKPGPPCKSGEDDLNEPTLFTKEAMDDINKMFGMPMDF